jgi:hypothetical protein
MASWEVTQRAKLILPKGGGGGKRQILTSRERDRNSFSGRNIRSSTLRGNLAANVSS